MPEFNPLDYPLSLMDPIFFGADSAWITHMPFAFALVEMGQPRVLVELGTHYGDSYCSFCQAVLAKQLATGCFAVDTWQGDPQAGYYNGEQILQALRAHHDPRYGKFSQLLRMEFDAAAAKFDDGAVDLLHIDGCHTYDAVSHDFQTWRNKMSPAGVVLFHDVAVRQPGFGAWRFWEEIAGQYPSFAFEHGSGLGVLAVGNAVAPPIVRFLEQASQQPQRVRDYFNWRGGGALKARLLTWLLNVGQQGQTLANEWRRQSGQPLNPMLADPARIFADPVYVVTQTLEQMRLIAIENLRLRSAQGAHQGVQIVPATK